MNKVKGSRRICFTLSAPLELAFVKGTVLSVKGTGFKLVRHSAQMKRGFTAPEVATGRRRLACAEGTSPLARC
jgi:hypothetical protein